MSAGDSVNVKMFGPCGAGKTSIILKFVMNEFSGTECSIGNPFLEKTVHLPGDQSDKSVLFHIYDTAGNDRNESTITGYFRNTDVVILVYDSSKDERKSFREAKTWMREVERMADMAEVKFVYIAGNKADLEPKKVVSETGRAFAQERTNQDKNGVTYKFLDTSAKTGLNLDDMFGDLAVAYGNRAAVQQDVTTTPDVIKNNSGRSKCTAQ